MTKRKFYRTTFKVVVLSESPMTGDEGLGILNDAITNGDCSGQVDCVKTETLDGKQAAKALQAQASDPEFFQIDENGNDSEG